MKKGIKILIASILLVVLSFLLFVIINRRDRERGYKADLFVAAKQKQQLRVGFAAVPITPELPDEWSDSDNNAEYNIHEGDTFTDGNGNGRFDAVWMAGFGNKRAAAGIHDDLWARTIVLDDGQTRLAVVSVDLIGFMNPEVIAVRKMLPESAGITYLVVASTHTHEGPDMLGLWGESFLKSGVNRKYVEFVRSRIVESVTKAAGNLEYASLEVSEDMEGAASLVTDSREPLVSDHGLRIIRAKSTETGETLGSLISWANHPETVWSRNLLITSDFPHYLREYVEKGIKKDTVTVREGTGGVCVYINGAIGGLMTTDPDMSIKDPVTGAEYSEPVFEKADALGKSLALLSLDAMENPIEVIDSASISLAARTVLLPVDNRYYKLGVSLGILKRSVTKGMNLRSELAVFEIGSLTFATFPGEVYPETVNGGVQSPEGSDFPGPLTENPSVRELMRGKHKFIIGLANDETGYIIPKTQWDAKPPFAYGRDRDQYGEENSLGPETSDLIYRNLTELFGMIYASK
jgi:hypothetical protein